MKQQARNDQIRRARPALGAAALAALAACGDSAGPPAGVQPCTPAAVTLSLAPAIAPARVPDHSPHDALFRDAGAEHGVPAALLRAIGYVETRWQMVEGHEEFPGVPAAYGIMALRGERLREGAQRAGVSESSARADAAANVRAAAALLRRHADALGIGAGDDVDAWAPAVARFSGIESAAGRESYVRDVLAAADGRRSTPAAPAASRAADPCPAPLTPPVAPATDQPGALWRPSPNFNARMAGDGGKVAMVIIHSCEGSYAGCWSWLANPASQVSAHYVVREDGAEVTQLVREPSRAWHIAATYDTALNAGREPGLHGVQSNHFTIGVEHGGFASQTSWPAAQLDASARLVCAVTKRWGIPRDRFHVVSHGQLQPHNRTDPGPNWPWADYLARIDRHCAG